MADGRQRLRQRRIALLIEALRNEALPVEALTARINAGLRAEREAPVGRRTIELDLAWMRRRFGPEVVERVARSRLESGPRREHQHHRAFYRLRGDQEVIPVEGGISEISELEALALVTARAALAAGSASAAGLHGAAGAASADGAGGGPLAEALDRLIARLGLSTRDGMPGWRAPEPIVVLTSPLQPYRPESLLTILRAVRVRRGLTGSYQPKHRALHQVRLMPAAVALVDGAPHLWAWDAEDRMVKRYEVSRLADLAVAPAVLKAPSDLRDEVRARLSGSFAGASRAERMRVVIRCDRETAVLLRDRPLGRAQRVEELPDGGLRIAFNTSGEEAVTRWVMSRTPGVVVEEPGRLRGRVRRALREGVEGYG